MWTKTAVHSDATESRPEGWHYAQVWKDGGGPIGFCAEHEPHPTEVEARECWSQWRREHIKFDRVIAGWTSCSREGCERPANHAATIEGDPYVFVPLCAWDMNYRTVIEVLGLDQPAGDSMGS